MEKKIELILENLISRYPALSCCREQIAEAYEAMKRCYDLDGKLLIAGNDAYICGDCVELCWNVLRAGTESEPENGKKPKS